MRKYTEGISGLHELLTMDSPGPKASLKCRQADCGLHSAFLKSRKLGVHDS